MPRTATTVAFDALQVVGGLLPSSLLEQVAEGRASEQDGADYGLERGERLRDQIDAAWVRLKELWAEYVDFKERAGQSAAGLHVGLRLLREVFGWSDLQPVHGYRQGEWLYPITHRAFGGAVPLILKGIPATDLDQGMTAFGQDHRKRSPHGCLQECLNADDRAVWGLICCGDGLRLLHDNPSLVKPAYLAVDLELLVCGSKAWWVRPPAAPRSAPSASDGTTRPTSPCSPPPGWPWICCSRPRRPARMHSWIPSAACTGYGPSTRRPSAASTAFISIPSTGW
jgi:hypothetical protein